MRLSFTSGQLAEALLMAGNFWLAAALTKQQQNPERFQWERIQQLLPADAPRDEDAADRVLSLRGSDYV
jgi:hypothetical protein